MNFTKEEQQVCREAVEAWGVPFQLDMVIEECAELINTILKYRRGRTTPQDITEEGVDVEIMINQLKIILNNPKLWKALRKQKITRTKQRLNTGGFI